MKKLLSLVMAVAMLLTAAFAFADEVTYDGTVYIGLSCALTGAAPAEGERTQQTVQLAIDQVNAAGGVQGKKVELIVYDDANDTSGALNSVSKLAADERVIGIIGPQRSGSVIACSDVLKQNTLPCITGGTSVLIYDCENPYIFRCRVPDSLTAAAVMKYLVEDLGSANVGIIFASNDFGKGGCDVALEWLESKGMTATACESINVGDTDFTATLLKMKDAGVNGFYVWADAAEDAILVRQYNELGLTDIPMAGSGSFANSTFFELLDEEYVTGLYLATDFSIDNPDEYVQNFRAMFKDAYGIEPDQFAGFYWDAAQIMLDSLSRCKEFTREGLREAILGVDIIANSGRFYSDAAAYTNDLSHQVLICRNEGKTPVVIGPVTSSDI